MRIPAVPTRFNCSLVKIRFNGHKRSLGGTICFVWLDVIENYRLFGDFTEHRCCHLAAIITVFGLVQCHGNHQLGFPGRHHAGFSLNFILQHS